MYALEKFCEEVQDELMPYGQYIVCKALPDGHQPFGVVEWGSWVFLVVGWAIREFVAGFIREKAKKAAESTANNKMQQLEALVSNLNQRIAELSVRADQTEQILLEVIQLCQEIGITREYPVGFEINIQGLGSLLHQFGLTERSASNCANALIPILNAHLRKLLSQGNDETPDAR